MQTQNGGYVSAADFDKLRAQLERTEEILSDTLNTAAEYLRKVEVGGITAADAEAALRATVRLSR